MSVLLYIQSLSFISLLFIASVQDIRTREIPNWIPLLLFVNGCLSFNGLASLIGLLATALPYLLAALFTNGKIGGGDIKLMASCGFMLGITGGLIQSIVGLTLVLLFSLVLAMFCGWKQIKQTPLPLAPFLTAGGIFAWLFLMI